MAKQPSLIRRVVESLGLDWLVMLIGRPAFQEVPSPHPSTFADVRAKFGYLQDDAKLDDAIAYCGELLKREDGRVDTIESKAFTLIGITSLAAGFITGFAGLLLDKGKIGSPSMLIAVAVLYVLIAFSLIWTVHLARKVVSVPDYKFTYPSATDIFALAHDSLQDVKRERTISLFYSFVSNQRIANRKATYLSGAQTWFRNSIALLVVLALVLAFLALLPLSGPTSNATSGVPATGTVPASVIATPPPVTIAAPSLPLPNVTQSPQPNPTATSGP